MVKDTKLYDLLSIKPDASESEIKKAYRKAALKYHPDKPTGDTEKFKEISEAFDILSNSEKKQLYDNYGLEAARHGGVMPEPGSSGAGGFPGAGGETGGFPGGFAFGGMPGGGGTRTFHFSSGGPGAGAGYTPFSSGDAFNIFRHFSDAGGMEDEDDDIFSMLGGRGRRPGARGPSSAAGGFPGGFPSRSQSPAVKPSVTLQLPVSLEDLASGASKKMKIKKRKLNGQQEEKIVTVQIRPGWKAGTKITYPNEGDQLPDGASQDVIFVIEEKPNSKFKRDGNNLEMDLNLSLKEALCGFTKIVETIDGKKLKISYNNPIKPGQRIEYPGHGMPISKTPGQRGALIITTKVDVPSQLTPAQKKAIQDNF